MKSEERKDFNKGASQWDENPARVKIAGDVADAIIRGIKFTKDMDALDFGCGTGLVTLRLQPLVGTITGVDSSQGMLDVLKEKISIQGLNNVRTELVDLEKGGRIEGKFHLLVCSMTLHHVPDTAAMFQIWHEYLLPGGHLCFSDLDTEDGSFHGDNTGVFHFGFDRGHLKNLLQSAGFSDIRDTTAGTMLRDIKGKGKREFPVFLIVAGKEL